MTAENDEPWGKLCDRGQLTFLICTLARPRLECLGIHPEARWIGVVRADTETHPPTAVGFESVASLHHFIAEMEPREVSVRCAPAEDLPAVLRELRHDAPPGVNWV